MTRHCSYCSSIGYRVAYCVSTVITGGIWIKEMCVWVGCVVADSVNTDLLVREGNERKDEENRF